jgi:hypothetical protein
MSVPLFLVFDWPCDAGSDLGLRASDLRRAECSSLLETFAAEDGTSLCGPEGNRGFLPALRAGRLCFRAHLGRAASSTFSALGLAAFASFWFVLKAFVGEKHLLAGSKDKLSAAFRTLQDPIVVFHEPLSPCPSQ